MICQANRSVLMQGTFELEIKYYDISLSGTDSIFQEHSSLKGSGTQALSPFSFSNSSSAWMKEDKNNGRKTL